MSTSVVITYAPGPAIFADIAFMEVLARLLFYYKCAFIGPMDPLLRLFYAAGDSEGFFLPKRFINDDIL